MTQGIDPKQLKHGKVGQSLLLKADSVARFDLSQGALLCVHHSTSGKCGAHLFAEPLLGPLDILKELFGGLGIQAPLQAAAKPGSAQAPESPIRIKAIGRPASLSRIREFLKGYDLALSSAVESPEKGSVAYFYGESGRLRLGIENTAPTPASALLDLQSSPVRVLIVDDSKTVRNLLEKVLGAAQGIEVVASAERPSQVEELLKTHRPDVVTLDVHMPEMDGVELLKRYLPNYPIPTVMISSISVEESNHILNALEFGAVDYIQKPSLAELPKAAPLIVEKVRIAARTKVRIKTEAPKAPVRTTQGPLLDPRTLIAIGSSTGGTEALRELLTRLPARIPPIVIAQHIPAIFSQALAKRLNDLCPFEVKEAQDMDEVKPGRVLIAPGGLQMTVENLRGQLVARVRDTAAVNRHKPSVDVLFDSVAVLKGQRSVGVILTGMGADGARGLLKLRNARARTIAQDEASSVVFGMPKEAIRMGAAEEVKPLLEIADLLVQWLRRDAAA